MNVFVWSRLVQIVKTAFEDFASVLLYMHMLLSRLNHPNSQLPERLCPVPATMVRIKEDVLHFAKAWVNSTIKFHALTLHGVATVLAESFSDLTFPYFRGTDPISESFGL